MSTSDYRSRLIFQQKRSQAIDITCEYIFGASARSDIAVTTSVQSFHLSVGICANITVFFVLRLLICNFILLILLHQDCTRAVSRDSKRLCDEHHIAPLVRATGSSILWLRISNKWYFYSVKYINCTLCVIQFKCIISSFAIQMLDSTPARMNSAT